MSTLVTGGNIHGGTHTLATPTPAYSIPRITGGIILLIIGLTATINGIIFLTQAVQNTIHFHITATVYQYTLSPINDLMPPLVLTVLGVTCTVLAVGLLSPHRRLLTFRVLFMTPIFLFIAIFAIITLLNHNYGVEDLGTWGRQHHIENLTLPDNTTTSGTFTAQTTTGENVTIAYTSQGNTTTVIIKK